MGLIIANIVLSSGIEITNSYARIDTVSGTKNSINASLNYYLNQQAFMDGKTYLHQEQYPFVPSVSDDAPNYHKQGYEYLKTLPDFAESLDA